MTCLKSNVPAPEAVDIRALRAKYAHERDKRIRSETGEQYASPEDHLVYDTREHDPFTPVTPRDAIDEDLDVAILGGGWTGILAGFHLKQAGVTNFRHIEHAGGFGGTWYWNRYPGIQCDNDAYCYLPLLEEMGTLPSKKFADGLEIYEYIQSIVDKYGFRENALLHTEIVGLDWQEDIKRWLVTTNRGDTIRARNVIMCGGTLSTPKFPGLPGLHAFKGQKFHTSRWDYDYTGGSWEEPVLEKLRDKRVAILGTGATSVQAVPYLGEYAKELFVIQRTPSSVDERPNPLTNPEWAASLQPGWQAARQENFLRAANEILPRESPDLICDIWTEVNRNLNAEREELGWPEMTMEEFMEKREVMDYRVMERLRKRVEDIVNDPETAEALKPYYRFMCKRPLSNNDYHETFNRPNVKLIDVSLTAGLEAMTEKGFMHQGTEYEIDCMVFASGFEVSSDLRRRWGIKSIVGRNDVSIYDYWADGPLTLNGSMAHNFPNMFFTGYIQGGLNGTTTLQFGEQVRHASWIISQALQKGITAVEPTQEGQDAYIQEFRANEVDLSVILNECTPSYFTNEGDKEAKWFLFRGWGPGWDNWQQKMEDWRNAGDMPGMRLDK